MQFSLRSSPNGSTLFAGTAVGRQKPCATRPERPLSLSVVAYKKKGQRMMRRGPASGMAQGMQRMDPRKNIPDLPVDPENEEFIMFVRSKNVPRWIPYTVMKGGWSANALAKAQGTKWGKNLYGDTLIKNIGQAFYKDLNKIEGSIRQNMKILKYAKVLEYGFKIRDKEKPDDWYLTEDVQLLPSREEVEKGGILDNVKDFFTGKKKLF